MTGTVITVPEGSIHPGITHGATRKGSRWAGCRAGTSSCGSQTWPGGPAPERWTGPLRFCSRSSPTTVACLPATGPDDYRYWPEVFHDEAGGVL